MSSASGPRAQELLASYLKCRDREAYCFSPTESEEQRLQLREKARRTPKHYGNRRGSNRQRKPARKAGARYSNDSYRRAIHRACEKAGVEKWSPNRLRHSTATRLRSQFGIEATSTVLGHSKLNTTEIYAERDLQTAIEIMRDSG